MTASELPVVCIPWHRIYGESARQDAGAQQDVLGALRVSTAGLATRNRSNSAKQAGSDAKFASSTMRLAVETQLGENLILSAPYDSRPTLFAVVVFRGRFADACVVAIQSQRIDADRVWERSEGRSLLLSTTGGEDPFGDRELRAGPELAGTQSVCSLLVRTRSWASD